jgi:hypothetical protein
MSKKKYHLHKIRKNIKPFKEVPADIALPQHQARSRVHPILEGGP